MDENLAVALQEVKDRSLRNEGRIKKLEETQQALNDLALSVRELATDQDNMKNDITEIKSDVKVLAAKPAKRWDSIVDKVLYAIIGAFVTWLFYGGAA